MGCIFTKRKFVVNSSVEGQDESALEVFQNLGLSDRDIDLLYTAFWDIDADSSGLIRPLELFNYFEVEETVFINHIFTLFDEDKSGMINFMEFVCTLWNLLTLPESDFGSLAYLIKDSTADGKISFVDVREILEMMHLKKIDKDPNLHSVYNQLRKDLSHKLSIEEFNRWTASNPSVTAPLMMLQLHIRLQIIGEKFWCKLAEMRKEDSKQGRLNYVKDLQRQIVTKNRKFREKQQAEEKERQRLKRLEKGRHGGVKENVQRKESILLRHFNLKQLSIRGGAYKRSLSRVIPISDLDDVSEVEDDNVTGIGILDPSNIKRIQGRDGSYGNTSPVRRRRSILRKPNLAPGQSLSSSERKRKDKSKN